MKSVNYNTYVPPQTWSVPHIEARVKQLEYQLDQLNKKIEHHQSETTNNNNKCNTNKQLITELRISTFSCDQKIHDLTKKVDILYSTHNPMHQPQTFTSFNPSICYPYSQYPNSGYPYSGYPNPQYANSGHPYSFSGYPQNPYGDINSAEFSLPPPAYQPKK